jgi:hypothetical protein
LIRILIEYETLTYRSDKSLFLTTIVDLVRQQNDGQANFIRRSKSSGSWIALSDSEARDKVGHALREVRLPRYKYNGKSIISKSVSNKRSNSITSPTYFEEHLDTVQSSVSSFSYHPYEPLSSTEDCLPTYSFKSRIDIDHSYDSSFDCDPYEPIPVPDDFLITTSDLAIW